MCHLSAGRSAAGLLVVWAACCPLTTRAEERNAARLFAEVAARNDVKESQLQAYSVLRTYQVRNSSEKLRHESKFSVLYRSPGPKVFQVLHEQGSSTIRNMVVRPLIEHETNRSASGSRDDTALTPANYTVEFIGDADLRGRLSHLLRVTPRRPVKYMIQGTLWIDAKDLAITQIDGYVRNPSFWVTKNHFVRQYEKVGSFWLPSQDRTTTEIKLFGKYILEVTYHDYKITGEKVDLQAEGPAVATGR